MNTGIITMNGLNLLPSVKVILTLHSFITYLVWVIPMTLLNNVKKYMTALRSKLTLGLW